MSNINNHGVGMNKINLAADFQELTCEQAAAIQGGARVELYRHENFQDLLLNVDGNVPNVRDAANDQVTSAVVNDGTWYFCTDEFFQGDCYPMAEGRYDNLTFNIGMPNDSLTSLVESE